MSNPVPTDVVQIGDIVTVQFTQFTGLNGSSRADDVITISGKVRLGPEGDLMLGLYIVAHANGNPGPETICVTERTPAEPPVGTVLEDSDGDYWVHIPDGWVCIEERHSRGVWKNIAASYELEQVKA